MDLKKLAFSVLFFLLYSGKIFSQGELAHVSILCELVNSDENIIKCEDDRFYRIVTKNFNATSSPLQSLTHENSSVSRKAKSISGETIGTLREDTARDISK